jgi:iron complex transport system ATP-binding protein
VSTIHPSNHSIIELDSVSYRRKEQYLFRNISWRIRPGENWVLFGPNGSGKTTLLKLITGYIHPSEGVAHVLGERIGRTNLPELRKQIGWISTSITDLIHDDDPAIEIVLAGAKASTRLWFTPTLEHEARANDLLIQLGCVSILNKPYGILSQGEQKKILIARALMNEPSLLILDEPCEGLDIASREQFLRDILKLESITPRPTIIFVSHYVEEILPFFTHILYLKQGNLFHSGTLQALMNSEMLSSLFEIPLEVSVKEKRYRASIL